MEGETNLDLLRRMWSREDELSLMERRARYKCKNKFVTLEQLKTWSELWESFGGSFVQNRAGDKEKGLDSPSASDELQSAKSDRDFSSRYSFDPLFNSRISIWQGLITTLEVDAIVNAANVTLLGGGGVDYAIHAAAGNELYEECVQLHGTDVGTTKITRGYKLPARFVLHTVGPSDGNPNHLASCYQSCLEFFKLQGMYGVGIEHNPIRSIAFCAVSTGIFGFPLEEATRIALTETRTWMENNRELTSKIDRIIFVTYNSREYECYTRLVSHYFPPHQTPIH